MLAILLVVSVAAPLLVSIVLAKPLEPHPEWPWVSGTKWGTKLRLENTYVGECWFGAGPNTDNGIWFTPPVYVYPVFKYGITYYDYIVWTQVAAPQSYSWYVEMITNQAYTGATLSTVLENATHEFVPHDFSIVLENAAENIFINLRENVANWWVPLPSHATLYVDNAVNATISPSSQTGDYGDNVSFTVTVSNTGRYYDTYYLTVDEGTLSYSILPSSLTISAGNSATATLTVTLSGGSQVITVTADGTYADDNASCTVTATAAKQYDLTANVDPPGSGSVTLDPAGGTYEEGTDGTATANPTSGYEFDHWSGDASGTSTSVTVTMNSEKSITAHFRSTGEGEAREEFPWTWIGAGIIIVVVIIVAVVAMTRRR